jgi:hypothetical protein
MHFCALRAIYLRYKTLRRLGLESKNQFLLDSLQLNVPQTSPTMQGNGVGKSSMKAKPQVSVEVAQEGRSAYPLALFRFFFGLILTRFFWDLRSGEWISDYFVRSQFQPKYDLLAWLHPNIESLPIIVLLLIISSICFTLGLFYRLNSLFLLVCYAYLYYLDATWCDTLY